MGGDDIQYTERDCNGDCHCEMCNLYGNCDDRRKLVRCEVCGCLCTDEHLYDGVCEDCLSCAISEENVMGYLDDDGRYDFARWLLRNGKIVKNKKR